MNQASGGDSVKYDHFGYLAFLFSLATVISFFVYIVAVYPGVDLQENIKEVATSTPSQPSEAEKIDLSQITEPWKPNPALVVHGKALYAQQCAMCHGSEGKGDGAAGAGLNPKPRNLVTGPWKLGGGYIGLFKALTEGIPGSSMSSYKHLSVVDRWALVQFIDSITQAKVNVSASELEAFARAAK
ncbi:MAG: cytochrome c [Bdellovibrionaceae bacterium]|nr:cytochrome c [Pseudobdellovibrionaceae bacterium]MDW8190946.1 cytochrome c [Pseudobdellovibrionaceae bacterium]